MRCGLPIGIWAFLLVISVDGARVHKVLKRQRPTTSVERGPQPGQGEQQAGQLEAQLAASFNKFTQVGTPEARQPADHDQTAHGDHPGVGNSFVKGWPTLSLGGFSQRRRFAAIGAVTGAATVLFAMLVLSCHFSLRGKSGDLLSKRPLGSFRHNASLTVDRRASSAKPGAASIHAEESQLGRKSIRIVDDGSARRHPSFLPNMQPPLPRETASTSTSGTSVPLNFPGALSYQLQESIRSSADTESEEVLGGSDWRDYQEALSEQQIVVRSEETEKSEYYFMDQASEEEGEDEDEDRDGEDTSAAPSPPTLAGQGPTRHSRRAARGKPPTSSESGLDIGLVTTMGGNQRNTNDIFKGANNELARKLNRMHMLNRLEHPTDMAVGSISEEVEPTAAQSSSS